MYYVLSVILGTVAFSYGSVPMYKMVRLGTRQSIQKHSANRYFSHHRSAKQPAGAANRYEHRATAAQAAARTTSRAASNQ